jgi:hypothetical protein
VEVPNEDNDDNNRPNDVSRVVWAISESIYEASEGLETCLEPLCMIFFLFIHFTLLIFICCNSRVTHVTVTMLHVYMSPPILPQ